MEGMMTIVLPAEFTSRLKRELRRARDREIGGIIMGEHVSADFFRIVDITVQRGGGGLASFVRLVESALDSLNRFFTKTGCDYRNFNYLGEWHSHPSFSATPSTKDLRSMQEIVGDPEVGANFAVLLVVKLQECDELAANATVFLPAGEHFTASLVIEDNHGR
jgi:[CysO sulfur-carrier protein]-S-L-cysteine hydrolase